MSDHENYPFLVIENKAAKRNGWWVVDDRGDKELGNWFIAACQYEHDAKIICEAYCERLKDGRVS